MKMMQQGKIFSPVALVVETAEEAEALWELARFTDCTGEPLSGEARAMAIKISNWFRYGGGDVMEHDTQAAFITWCAWNEAKYPMLKLAFAIPNGAHLAGDTRTRAIKMSRLKAEGFKPGVPDWHLPYRSSGYEGLWIEFKFGKNKLSIDQANYIAALERYRHCVQVCYTVDEAINAVEDYLNPKHQMAAY